MFRNDLAETFKQQLQINNPEQDIGFTDAINNAALIQIENLGLPLTNRWDLNILSTEIMREISYDKGELIMYINDNLPELLHDQRRAYSTVIKSIKNNTGGLYFLYIPAFVNKILLAKVHQENEITFATVTTGIAATLLPGVRTAHSAFKLPLDLPNKENPVCNISQKVCNR
ncbi:ATP-dependent DNA helicase [Octopus vulgaris]|uniref:ATP-dependent DNA helicase n=1 Tax=Octopus vulgaris TaxID=6645 RepID=A0AA36F734_OCTVU|nr:ATP-dependent DNA helicase [Octopus vulgaris]